MKITQHSILFSVTLMIVIVFSGSGAHAECVGNRISLKGNWGRADFSVEIADEAQERARGLMFREESPQSSGMLFVFDKPGSVSFWMMNTLIPLDMIFLDETGTVKTVHHDAVPLDKTRIFGGEDIRYVLEVNGGLSRQLGIVPGSVVRHPLIEKAMAAWPC